LPICTNGQNAVDFMELVAKVKSGQIKATSQYDRRLTFAVAWTCDKGQVAILDGHFANAVAGQLMHDTLFVKRGAWNLALEQFKNDEQDHQDKITRTRLRL
jgi:hypothetical protein